MRFGARRRPQRSTGPPLLPTAVRKWLGTHMEVRVALPTDAGSLEPLFDALGHPASPRQLTLRLERLGNDPTYIAWVARMSGQTVGFAAGHVIHPIEDDAPAGQLIALVTDPHHSGRGVGTALCQEFEAWARGQGAQRTVVNSGDGRTAADRFYKRQGYECTGLRLHKPLVTP